jgi:predicted ribosome quality control (RQC) complex YloA/Tae2 family protein
MKQFTIHAQDCSFEFVIGSNANENTKLVKQFKKENDVLWFHLHNLPSCHGFLKINVKEKIPKTILKQCAHIIKENSKCPFNSKVEFTNISNVKTTDTPGLVVLTKKPNII